MSFGDEDEIDEDQFVFVKKSMSSHDSKGSKQSLKMDINDNESKLIKKKSGISTPINVENLNGKQKEVHDASSSEESDSATESKKYFI